MKKLIQVLSFLSLVIVFSVVSAKAQSVKEYKAQIPYDFNIGQKSYKAGDYVIKVSDVSSSTVALTLQDDDNNNLQTILVRENGNVAKKEPKLHFTTIENQRFLTAMSTKEMGVSILASKKAKQLARMQGKPETNTETAVVVAK